MQTVKLEFGNFYHIYNHAVGGRNLFFKPDNYSHFLSQYEKYISPIADTYAWVLMPNHFHFLVKIKGDICYKYSNVDGSFDAVKFDDVKWETTGLSACKAPDNVKIPKPEKHFSHLFNSYARHFNTKYQKRGALFERPFNRKLIDSDDYLRSVLLYIHNNPIHHGFCAHPMEYPWSSYQTCISLKSTKLQREEVIGWFDDEANFKFMHNKKVEVIKIEEWLEI